MDPKTRIKNIEVVDSRTGLPSKVACMSCIRGHRTTTCGSKPVCRTKLFWTVKRPGRPANACTCPLGTTGRCQCVIATSACTHRTKKGEGRAVDCRCDEQGRWCCVLGPDEWKVLLGRGKLMVQFHSSPEALNAAREGQSDHGVVSTTLTAAGIPHPPSLPDTPGTMSSTPFTPRSSLLFDGSPTGQYNVSVPGYTNGADQLDVRASLDQTQLGWQSLTLPEEQKLYSYLQGSSPGPLSVSNGAQVTTATMLPPDLAYRDTIPQHFHANDPLHVTQSLQDLTMQSLQAPLEIDKLMEDYFNFQFPSAICQNCGLAGCNCRSCPAVMQSSVDGSWAQCCSRKHARTSTKASQSTPHSSAALEHVGVNGLATRANAGQSYGADSYETIDMTTSERDLFHAGLDMVDPALAAGIVPMVLSDFVTTDPDLPSHGCCCGGDT